MYKEKRKKKKEVNTTIQSSKGKKDGPKELGLKNGLLLIGF